jgi:hypothetical protein
MAPDDPSGIRELKFRHGPYHIIVTASPEGTGSVKVIGGGLYDMKVSDEEAKEAVKATIKMISIARHWVFEEFKRLGGTVEELRQESTAKVNKL